MRAQYFLLTVAIITLFFLSQLFNPFLKAMFVALLLTIATNSLYTMIYTKTKNSVSSSFLVSFILATIFFVPLLYFIFTFAKFLNNINKDKVVSIYNVIKDWVINIPDDFIFIKHQLIEILEKVDISNILQNILSIGAYLGKNSATFMIDMVMILIFYFFYNLYSKQLSNFFKEILPINIEDGNRLFKESSNVMSIVLYSILVTAIFEGLLFGVFISFFGYDGLLLGVLYGFASLVPVIGGAIMWLPISIYEIFNGELSNAFIIASYSIIIISIVADTFIKPVIIKYINKKIVKTPSAVNEILIFFSIVAGLSTFGFWGMIIGPAMVTFFISILQLLKKYSNNMI